ncbi:MAG: hypothetical protein JWM80_5118 [Cyanobacteria bacterium RYN_339]|nr:hypothetical protein [Cyanobacteria bacterium RYN_339]
MSEQHNSYGDDGPAYGDDGPAYSDDGPAYDVAAYDDVITYGDEGPIGEGQPAYEEEPTYAEDAGGAYVQDEVVDEVVTETDGAAPRKGPGAKRLALIGAALLGVVGLGAGGYMMLAGDGDPMAMLRGLPVVGDLLGPATPVQDAKAPDPKAPGGKGNPKGAEPAPEAASGEGGLLAPLWAMLPRGTESDEATLVHADNLNAVRAAITAYEQEHHALPASTSAIVDKLRELDYKPVNPYNQGQSLVLNAGDMPSAAGAMAYALKKGTYQLRVGDKHGQPLKVRGIELVLEGTGAEAVADATDPKAASPKPAPSPSAAVAVLPTPKDSGGKGIDRLGGVIPPGKSPLPSAGPPASPPAVVADPGQVPLPGSSLTPRQVFELRVKRNREFDFWRVKGISLVYSKRTLEALEAFKKALAIRPNDESVMQWVTTINDVIDKRDKDVKAKYDEEKAARMKEIAAQRGGAAAYVPPPPPRVQEPPAPAPKPIKRDSTEDAGKMLEELKKADKVPMLAPPKLDP